MFQLKQIPSHIMLYLWRQKTSVFSEDDTLVGCRAVPLRDVDLNARMATYDICDLRRGLELAQVRLRCSLFSVPGPIQLPHLEHEAGTTTFQIHWSEPLDDRGRPVLAYRIAMCDPLTQDWTTACERTKKTSFTFTGLTPSSVYIVDIRAINSVGAGDSTELEVATADEEGLSPASLGGCISPHPPPQHAGDADEVDGERDVGALVETDTVVAEVANDEDDRPPEPPRPPISPSVVTHERARRHQQGRDNAVPEEDAGAAADVVAEDDDGNGDMARSLSGPQRPPSPPTHTLAHHWSREQARRQRQRQQVAEGGRVFSAQV